MEEFFGIDFGTTNSAVVGLLRKKVTNYDDGEGQPFPSLVAVSETTGQVQALGRQAWNHREELSESCRILSSAKMYLGTGQLERIGPEMWSPERVVTEVLKGLKERVAQLGNGTILDNPVMAIPVGFPPARRKALREAARAARITIRGFVTEPTAAVFRNYKRVCGWPIVVVFDWGGGTLDISVVGIKGRTVQEIATVSKRLGGDDLNVILAEWAHMQILRDKGKDGPPFSAVDSRYRDILVSQCETAKRMLSDEESWEISMTKYGELGTISVVLRYDDFSSLMEPKIQEVVAALDESVVHRARLSFDQIGCIIMVGGSSKLRGLREAMDDRQWSCDVVYPEDSDWHVAGGAAMLASDFGDYVCAQNIGVRLCDNTVFPLLTCGETIDYRPTVTTFGLIEDADNARFVFVEGQDSADGRVKSMDRILGYLSVHAYGFSLEPIKLEAYVDEDLLFHVSAQSERRSEKHRKTWTYPELRFSYELPVQS